MKNIKKANQYRIIVWGTIFLLSLSAGILGFVSFNNGKGDIGSVVIKTKPLTETFNNLNSIKNYSANNVVIKSSVKKSSILVSFDTYAGSYSFEFIYEKLVDDETLCLTYNKTDENIASIVAKEMIEAVSVKNGHREGEVFEKFGYDDFLLTSILDGVKILDDGQIRKVYININKSILDSNSNVLGADKTKLSCNVNKFDTNTESNLIYDVTMTFDDEQMVKTLKSNKEYKYETKELYNKFARKISEKTGTGEFDSLTSNWELNDENFTYTISSDNTYEDLVTINYSTSISISDYSYYSLRNYFQSIGLTCE